MFSTLVFGFFSGITHFDLILGLVFFVIFSIKHALFKSKNHPDKIQNRKLVPCLGLGSQIKFFFFQKQLVFKLMESPERGFQNGFLKKNWQSDSGDIFKF